MLRISNQHISGSLLVLLMSESVLILGTFHLATTKSTAFPDLLGYGQKGAIPILLAVICQLCLYYCDLYDLKAVRSAKGSCVRLLQALGACSVLIGSAYTLFSRASIDPGLFLEAVFVLFGVLICWRTAFFWLCKKRMLRNPTLILGTGELAKKLAAEILSRPEIGVRIVGFVSEDRALVGKSLVNPTVLGHTSDLRRIIERERVSEVLVAMPESRGSMPITELLDLKVKGVSVVEATTRYEEITGKIAVENLRPSWLVFSRGFKKSRFTLLHLRMISMLFSALGLVVCFPIMIVVAILIRLDSKGPVLFRQERVGKDGKTFQLLKFRSMVLDAEEKTGPVWARENDDRVTHIGRIIRKLHLDELPQFVNVLRGDMSFVGPRPERPEFVKDLSQKILYYNQRHVIKPGITGWAQVKHQYGASIDDAIEKLQYDLFYIKNLSVLLDLYIIFQTVKIVTLGRGAR